MIHGQELKGKYIKIDFYSKRDVYLGKKYIEVSDIGKDEKQPIEIFFKLQDVSYYKVSVADKPEEGEIEILPKDLTKPEIILGTAIAFLIFWG